MLLNKIKGLLPHAPAPAPTHINLRIRTNFALQYQDVLKACRSLQEAIELPPKQLACRYMSCILTNQQQATWWTEHAPYLTQPWFIYEYACDHLLIQRKTSPVEKAPDWFVIEPEEPVHPGYVQLLVSRTIGHPERGSIQMRYEHADKAFLWLARGNHFQVVNHQYVRTIGEADGDVCDRLVETALRLLTHGYGVCVAEARLHQRIIAEDYVPTHPYWVLEGSAVDRLELRYPRDKVLHGHVYRAGGRWTGSTVEISICNAHLLDDLIRLYGFQITSGAQQRMAAWQDMLRDATIYHPRKRKGSPPAPPVIDHFKELMTHKPDIIEDLCDSNE